jgi:hypothetical protein
MSTTAYRGAISVSRGILAIGSVVVALCLLAMPPAQAAATTANYSTVAKELITDSEGLVDPTGITGCSALASDTNALISSLKAGATDLTSGLYSTWVGAAMSIVRSASSVIADTTCPAIADRVIDDSIAIGAIGLVGIVVVAA